jgi:hypothetical protein
MSCVTFWVVIRRMVFNNRRFGTLLHLWRWNIHSVPKRRLLNIIRRRTTQKITHDKNLTDSGIIKLYFEETTKIVQCFRKVAVHLGYGTWNWLSVSKLMLKCAVVSLYSVVKQRLKCSTVKVCNCLIQFLLTMVLSVDFQHLLQVHSNFPKALYKTYEMKKEKLLR